VGGVIWVLATSYGFLVENEVGQLIPNPELPAPQGNLMATIVQGVLGGAEQPLLLFALGGLMAVLLEMAAVPALAFGLGMYLPIEINLAIFTGAGVGYFIGRSGKTDEEKAARKEQGTLIASGLMAGAAIMGTIGAFLLLPQAKKPFEWIGIDLAHAPMEYLDIVFMSEVGTGGYAHWYERFGGQLLSVVGVAALIACCYFLARKGAREQMEEEGE
jgi:hypothetical protein